MTREEHKKMLIVQGMLHRLELVQATQQLRQSARPVAVVASLPRLLTLLASSKALPLLGSALTLVTGKSAMSRLLRRGLIIAGVGSVFAAVFRRWKQRTSEPETST